MQFDILWIGLLTLQNQLARVFLDFVQVFLYHYKEKQEMITMARLSLLQSQNMFCVEIVQE